jgi:regulator of sigma E protease
MTALSFFLAFAGFAFLIVMHEAGHFAAAKAVGMRVERFALFFPPLLVKKTIGETEYGIGAIPLGGYVRISGMNPSEDLPDDVRTRAYYAQPVWKRIVVIAAGPFVNLVLAFVFLMAFLWLVGPPFATATVEKVDAAPAAGKIDPGDRIVSVGAERSTPDEISMVIGSHGCPWFAQVDGCRAVSPVLLGVQKPDGKTTQVRLTPVFDGNPDISRMRTGFRFGETRDPMDFGQALVFSADRFAYITIRTINLPATLLDPVQRAQIRGVVGTYETTRQTILHDPADVLWVLAVISLSLAVINLFPFLPLDGGHIFWAVVEKVRRRPVSFATMERAGVVGILLLIPLFVVGFTNDLGRLFGEGFGPPL